MNRHLLGKNFPTKSNIFHTNPNNNLKNRCHSKIILGHAVFKLLFESNFVLAFFVKFNLMTVAIISCD